MASQCVRHDRAWDAATGSGQAALGLAPRFGHVIASDFSAAQVAHATRDRRITYLVARVESSALRDDSIDLVTIAQSLHWLNLPAAFAEVRRVLRPAGTIAVWTYGSPQLDDPATNAILRTFSREVVGPYWPSERSMVDAGYAGIHFPFGERPAPAFTLEASRSLPELLGYVRTWSATTRYMRATGVDPVIALEDELGAAWGAPQTERAIRWPIALRIGVV